MQQFWRWTLLVALSVLSSVGLEALHLPAALLLGPMLAGIVLAVGGAELRLPHQPVLVAQAVIGCMIARSIPLSVVGEIAHYWPLFAIVVTTLIAASSALGWLLTAWRVLPGTTAVWGSSPGAASAMMLMAAAYGADVRLVAFMQYLRVCLVALVATIVARLWTGGGAASQDAIAWFAPIPWLPFGATLLLIAFGTACARLRRVPAAPLLVPLSVGLALQGSGWMTIILPPWLLAMSYLLIGWSIGLGFNRSILAHAVRALPRVVLSILVLIAICGLLAGVLVVAAGIDPLTAYLATSPGGADTAAIIALASNVDVAFVMAMQTTRLILVLLIGPSLERFVAKRTGVGNETEDGR